MGGAAPDNWPLRYDASRHSLGPVRPGPTRNLSAAFAAPMDSSALQTPPVHIVRPSGASSARAQPVVASSSSMLYISHLQTPVAPDFDLEDAETVELMRTERDQLLRERETVMIQRDKVMAQFTDIKSQYQVWMLPLSLPPFRVPSPVSFLSAMHLILA
jgi:hypothetical protein